jgi:hypothetical protein
MGDERQVVCAFAHSIDSDSGFMVVTVEMQTL